MKCSLDWNVGGTKQTYVLVIYVYSHLLALVVGAQSPK